MKKIIAVALSTLVLTVVMAQVAQAQTIDSISPTNADRGQIRTITVTGSAFPTDGSTCGANIVPDDDVTIDACNIVDSFSANFSITVDEAADRGVRSLTVTVGATNRAFNFNIGIVPAAERTIPTGITTAQGFVDAIRDLTDWLFVLLVIISVVFIVLAGLQFITGGGDPTAVSQARTKLIWAAVGIGVALLARGLPEAIENLIGT